QRQRRGRRQGEADQPGGRPGSGTAAGHELIRSPGWRSWPAATGRVDRRRSKNSVTIAAIASAEPRLRATQGRLDRPEAGPAPVLGCEAAGPRGRESVPNEIPVAPLTAWVVARRSEPGWPLA